MRLFLFWVQDGANRINISENISFQSDFITCTGKDVYYESVVRANNSFLLPLLSEVSINISSKVTSQNYLSSSGIKVLSVRWNVSFIPETVSFFNFIGEKIFECLFLLLYIDLIISFSTNYIDSISSYKKWSYVVHYLEKSIKLCPYFFS